MPAAKTSTDYHRLAAARGLDWLGQTPPGTQRLTAWRCRAAGHVFERSYNHLQSIQRCPECVGRIRKTPSDYRALAATRGWTWLGPAVTSSRATTRWRCAAGHVVSARYSNVQQGTGCPACSGRARKTAADFRALGRQKGLRWLGQRALPTALKTRWRCAAGHGFRASYNTVQAGHACPACAGRLPRVAADYRRIGREHGLTWLGPLPPLTSVPTRWRCQAGHVWTTRLDTVRRGHRCPHCSGHAPKTAADYRALARARRYRWRGQTLPPNTATKTLWECSLGHRWSQRYSALQQGSGCPTCARRGRAGLKAAIQRLQRAAAQAKRRMRVARREKDEAARWDAHGAERRTA